MNRKTAVVVLSIGLSLSACDYPTTAEQPAVCKSNQKTVCEIPFELVYAERDRILGKSIRLHGVLITGVRPEAPNKPVALLFPSIERAGICINVDAIEILTASKEIADELKEYEGQWVSIAGTFEESISGEWGVLHAQKGPTLLESEKHALNCMKPPAPEELRNNRIGG